MMRIRRGTLKALGTSTSLALKVRSTARPGMIRSVTASTAEALRREFPRLNYVSEPLPTPASAVVVIDAKDLPSARVKDLLERFRTLLEEFGLTEGEISASNEDGPFDFRTFDQSMLSASLVAVPPFRAPWLRYDAVMPEQWVRAAASWLTEAEPSSVTLRFGWLEPTTVPSQDVGDMIATATGEGRLSGSLQTFAGYEGSLSRALNIR